MMDETLRVLYAARDRVMRGWCQFQLLSEQGEVCALGAIHNARAGRVMGDTDIDVALSARRYLEAECGQNTVTWNNAMGRTQAEVVDAFDRAIKARERDLEGA